MNKTPETILAESISIGTNFPKLCRQAVKHLGIYFDESQYWWIWNNKEYKWQETDLIEIFNRIDDKITESANTIDPKIKCLLMEALKREGRKNKPNKLDWHWIQFKDKLINFITNDEMDATSKYFITNPIPWKVGSSDKTPQLDKLLSEWLNHDKMKKEDKRHVDYLKELFAFTIVPKYFISTVPFLYGRGGDGKTQFLDTLIKFIGPKNEHSSTINSLEHTNFGTYDLRKKLMCSVYEVPKNNIVKFTNIKSISGRDGNGEISITKKGYQSVKEEVYAKFFLVGNDVPICKDNSDGFFRRIVPIKFPNKFEEAGDIFETIPDKEYNNLAFWCLNKLKDLNTTYNLMCNKGTIEEKKKAYQKASNQIIHFMESVGYIKIDNHDLRYPVTQLFNEFNRWADENNHNLLDYKEFKAKLENLGILTDISYITRDDGNRTRLLFAFGLDKQPLQAKGNQG